MHRDPPSDKEDLDRKNQLHPSPSFPRLRRTTRAPRQKVMKDETRKWTYPELRKVEMDERQSQKLWMKPVMKDFDSDHPTPSTTDLPVLFAGRDSHVSLYRNPSLSSPRVSTSLPVDLPCTSSFTVIRGHHSTVKGNTGPDGRDYQ